MPKAKFPHLFSPLVGAVTVKNRILDRTTMLLP
jgi:hypothetical protein